MKRQDIIDKVFGLRPLSSVVLNEGDEERKFYSGKDWDKTQLNDVVEILNNFKDLLDEINGDKNRGDITDGTLGSLISHLVDNSNNLIEICDAIEGIVDKKDNPQLPAETTPVEPAQATTPAPQEETNIEEA